MRKPRWKNLCGHPELGYIGTVSICTEEYDVYVYHKENDDDNICLRYGNSGEEYIGGIGVSQLICGAACGSNIYKEAVWLLKNRGTLRYELRTP